MGESCSCATVQTTALALSWRRCRRRRRRLEQATVEVGVLEEGAEPDQPRDHHAVARRAHRRVPPLHQRADEPRLAVSGNTCPHRSRSYARIASPYELASPPRSRRRWRGGAPGRRRPRARNRRPGRGWASWVPRVSGQHHAAPRRRWGKDRPQPPVHQRRPHHGVVRGVAHHGEEVLRPPADELQRLPLERRRVRDLCP